MSTIVKPLRVSWINQLDHFKTRGTMMPKRVKGKLPKTKETGLSILQGRGVCFAFGVCFIPETTPYYEDNWTQVGVSNWKKGIQKIKEHETADIHLEAAFKYSYFISGQNIKTCFSKSAKLFISKRKKKVEENRRAMTTIFEVVLCLARQNLPFRGHDESKLSSNRGNFKEIIDLVAKYDLALARQLKDNPKYGNYLTPASQNEMIYSLAEVFEKGNQRRNQGSEVSCNFNR